MKSTSTGKIFRVNRQNNCQTKNIVYVIRCPVCHKQYIGETGRTASTRISEHKRDIKNRNKKSPVAIHCQDHDVDEDDIKIILLDSSPANKNHRLRLEEAYIRLLNTMTPAGMNNKL